MKAAVFHGPRDITVEEIETPRLLPGDVLIRIRACGICGSDPHTYKHGLFVEQLGVPVDSGRVLGHEFSGDVAEISGEVKGLKVGDRVTCVSNGGNAEYLRMPAVATPTISHIPPEVSYEEAAMCEPLATGVTAAIAARISLGDSVAVIGVGHIGLMVLAAAKAAGAAPLIAIDKIDARLEAARRVGADLTLNPQDTNLVETVVDVTEAGLDVVFPCVSFQASGVLEEAFEMVRRRCRIILVGAPARATLPTGKWLTKEVRIEGPLQMGQEMAPALRLLQYKRANVEPCITEIMPLAEAQRAFDSLHDQTNIAVLLKP